MDSINQSALRVGNITSSEIVAIMSDGKAKDSLGKPFFTYIEECIMERKLGRSLSTETSSRPTTWGNLCEGHCFNMLGIKYSLTSKVTLTHPEFNYWTGTPDGIKYDEGKTVVDFKCPFTLKSFCQLVDPIYKGYEGKDAMYHIRNEHKDGEKYYWQLVSNAILSDCKYGELIVYVPYKSELDIIKSLPANYDGNQNQMKWVEYAWDDELPYLIDGGYYKNINIIRFEIPDEDKQALTKRVRIAGEYLAKG